MPVGVGLPPLDGAQALGRWTFDLAGVLLVVVPAVLYMAGVRRVRAAGGSWPALRTAGFAAGLVGVGLATLSFLGAYAHTLFWVYTLQVCLLLTLLPALLAVGRPVGLLRATLPAGARLRRLTDGGLLRTMSSPVVGPLLLPVAFSAVYFTPLLRLSLEHRGVYELLHVALLGLGVVIALPLSGDADPDASSLSLGVGLFVGFVELLLDAIPGIVVRLSTHLLAGGWYARLHRPWGRSPLGDQQLGGGILWTLAELIDLPFLGILLLRWIRADEREAARVDRELDRAGAEAVRSGSAVHDPSHGPPTGTGPDADTSTRPGDPTAPTLSRPWWEDDPSVFGAERGARYRRQPRRR